MRPLECHIMVSVVGSQKEWKQLKFLGGGSDVPCMMPLCLNASSVPLYKRKYKEPNIRPGWNELVAEQYAEARRASYCGQRQVGLDRR